MKRIIKSNFKFSLSNNLNKKVITIPVKHIRSTAGIREPPSGKKDKYEIEDVIGFRVGKIGIVELNKEHKLNILTESFMTDIRRSLEAMEIDEDMRVIILRSKHFDTFSMGTDLNYLYYKKSSGEFDKIDEYLEKLYNFNYFISIYHKPLLALCTGYPEEDLSRANIDSPFFKSMHEWTESWEEIHAKNQEEKNKFNVNNMNSHLSKDEMKKLNLLSYNEPFKYPWERQEGDKGQSPDPTVFHSMIEKDIQSEPQSNFKDYKGRYFNDTYDNFMKLVLSKIPQGSQNHFSLAHVVKDINRLFRFNSVKEIYEALKEENSYFSEFCLSALDKKSPLSLEVTLKMLRNARKMNYTEIIKQEINVAKNLIMKSKDFDSFMKNKIAHSKEKIKFFKSLSQITEQDVDEIFQDSKILQNIKLDVKDNSLLPHNKYFEKYPDCFRLWINENQRAHGDIRENFDHEIKHFMIEKFGIDLRDSNVTVDEVRKIITKIEINEHTKEKNSNKFSNLLSDPKFLNEYFYKRQNIIEKYQNDKEGLKEKISQKMKKLYEDSLIEMNIDIHDQCRDIREIEKRRTYLRLKRWLFMNRIMEYKTRRSIINSQRVNALGSKAFFIPEDLNVSYRDTENPELKNSPFYRLVGLFTAKTISPEYALNFSTTNPNRDILTHLEINQEKLNQIKEELKQNPNKFLEVWDSVYDKQVEAEFAELEDKSLVEYERVYRMRHEGHSTLDKLPFYKEYQEMKSKWMEYKNKTTEILKKMTHDMITQIIENENLYNKNLKQAAEDNSNSELEKFQDLKAIYRIVSGDKSDLEEFYEINSRKSTTVTERVNMLKQNIQNSINMDPFYQKLGEMIKETEKSHNTELKEFFTKFNQKVIELTQNLVIKTLIENVNSKSDTEMKNFTSDLIESSLIKLFNISGNKTDSASDSDFINWLYLKYGTQNIFSEILKKSKFSIIYLLKNQIENELFNHNNLMLSKIKENKIPLVRAIYNKEKSLLEDVLKRYFETKLNLLNLEMIEKKEIIEAANDEKSSVTMDYVIDTLREISFCHILLNNADKVPQSLNSILKKFEDAHKEKNLIELYVNVQEIFASSGNNSHNSEVEKNLRQLLKFVTKEMKNSEWFAKLVNLTEHTKDNINIDRKVEEFMKKRFNEIIYGNMNSIDAINDVDYYVDMRKIQDMLREKFEVFNLNNLINDYRNDKVSLNEENYTTGTFSHQKKLNEKKDFYLLKLDLSEKLKKLEEQFNIENLKKKYSDYLFNADFFIHKIICNMKNSEEIFTEKIEDNQNFGKFLFDIKDKLDQTYFDLSAEEAKSENLKSFNHLTRLKSILFNQKEYVENLENLKYFIENKSKFNDIIERELIDKLDFVTKYEVKILLSEIQADSEKLYHYLKSSLEQDSTQAKKILIDRKDFIIDTEKFYKQFSKVSLDELIGLEGTNMDYLSQLNKRMKEIVKNELETMTNVKLENTKQVKVEVGNQPADSISVSPHRLNEFTNKISSTIKGLKTIQLIKNNDFVSDSNKSIDFKEYVKNIENPGINYSKVWETLLGKKLSLQELINDDRQKTLYDYLQDTTFDKVFSRKIPVDLVKCAVQVFDARLIKAMKLILSSDLQNEFSLNDFIQYTGNRNYLKFKPGYFTDEEAIMYSQILGDIQDYRVEHEYAKKRIAEDEEENVQEFITAMEPFDKQAEEAEKYLKDIKQIAIATYSGQNILISYKKGSLFNNILNIHKLDANKKREFSEKLVKKLQEIVPFPDLSSQYTLLKYVYDYHMGNLQTFYENHRNEAESRIVNLNNVLFLEKIERMEKYDPILVKLYPEKNFFNPASINSEEDPRKEYDPAKLKINFELNTKAQEHEMASNPNYKKDTEHLYKYSDEEGKKLVEKSQNIAFEIFVTQNPSDWKASIENEKDGRIREIVTVELDRYYYIHHNMQLEKQGNKEQTFKDRKAGAMLLTEEFRAKQEKVKIDNEKIRNNEFNLQNENQIGFDHLLENNGQNMKDSRETQYYQVLDEMFGEYLKNKKEKLAYTKEKIREQKEKHARMDNLRVLNPYELISNSQESYIDMKAGKINDEKFKISVQSYLKWNNINKEYAVFNATDLTDIVDLDNAASRAVFGKYASIPSQLVDQANYDPDTEYQNGEHTFDKNEVKWFDEQIEEILSNFLHTRKDVEKYLTRDQLKALDEDLIKNFTHENFINRLKQNLNREVLSLNYLNDVQEHLRNSFNDQYRQRMKIKNNQYEFNKNLKDENAFYQNMAYQIRNDKEYNDKIEEDVRKKRKLGRSLKPDKNIEHPLVEDEGWKSLYYRDSLNAQLFNKDRIEGKENFLKRMNANAFNSLDKTATFEGITSNQKFNHMKTITEEAGSNYERISGMYRRKASEILSVMREKSERLEKLDKLNDYINTNKVGKLH